MVIRPLFVANPPVTDTFVRLPVYRDVSVVLSTRLPSAWYRSLSRMMYCQTSDIRRTLVGNTIVDHSDLVEALPVSAAPTTSSLST